ncbi:MAG: amidohydrolase family protein [Bdellovibrio sp.]|nr:amidohydrolase family protein [Bdellovibrio sp.]
MIQTIKNCYDSHIHFLAIGQVAAGLQLQSLASELEIQNIQIKPQYYRESWIQGFGWDQNKWSSKKFPHKKTLDQIFPDTPVFLSRVDGHASWINSKAVDALTKKGYDFSKNPVGGTIARDEQGEVTGVLFDQAHINALLMMPHFTDAQTKAHFEISQKLLNQGGFTHARDLSMNLNSWQILSQMSDDKKISVCVDSFVTAENLGDLPRVLNEISAMKKNPSPFLKIHGVKLFVDGSLGSKTAFLSQNYLQSETHGMMSWATDEIKQALKMIWQSKLEVAIHTIGDQAVHEVVLAARQVSAEGILGRLHLEHVQIVRPETIQLMKPLHITCHMQPCHWLSDHSWLPEVLPVDLLKNLFPWEALRKNKIAFDFGSDAPIEPSLLLRNLQALQLSAQKSIPALADDWKKYHAHCDLKWTNSWTEFDESSIRQVYFDGQPLL